jgi:p-aminobenzoyl-glutamate transporter AbgT
MMKCDLKTMMKAALGLAVVVAVAYATLPAARGWITVSAPFLFFLICPLMMFFMMKGMQSCHKEQKVENDQADNASNKALIGHAPLKD